MTTIDEMKAAAQANNDAQDHDFLAKIVEDLSEETPRKQTCQTAGCDNNVNDDNDICHGCEAELSHHNFWGSGTPMGYHKPS